jgi:hypothetical protein
MQIIFNDIDEIKSCIEESIYANSKTRTLRGTNVSINVWDMWHTDYVRANGAEVIKKVRSKLKEE